MLAGDEWNFFGRLALPDGWLICGLADDFFCRWVLGNFWHFFVIFNLLQINLRGNFFNSQTPRKVSHFIGHNKTNHNYHFCWRDHISISHISHICSSRLFPKIFFSDSENYWNAYKNLCGWPIPLKFGMVIESGQERFLMSWIWKIPCTMGQNLNFTKKIKFEFLRMLNTFNSKSMWFQH